MLKFMKEKKYKIGNNKKGMTAIEMVIGVMIFILVLSFMLDILMLFWKFSVVSQTTTQIARTTGIQGGALTKAPAYWPNGDGYLDINTLNSMVQDKMDTANIDNWVIKIDDGMIGTKGIKSTSKIDYKKDFVVSTTIDYKWVFTSNFIPGMDITQSLTAKRPSMSEWKYDYKTWNGE